MGRLTGDTHHTGRCGDAVGHPQACPGTENQHRLILQSLSGSHHSALVAAEGGQPVPAPPETPLIGSMVIERRRVAEMLEMKSQRWLMDIKEIIASPVVYGKVVVLPSGDTPVEEESCQVVGDRRWVVLLLKSCSQD